MYDLWAKPEQTEPAPTRTEMESPEETQALGCRPGEQEHGESREQGDKKHGLLDKDIPAPAHLKTSLLGKRHHSLYANLHGFEMEGLRKVSSICVFSLHHRWGVYLLLLCQQHS